MTKEKISIKFLIHLVGERPALWDKTSEAYRDRSLKETSWREICTYITDHYEHMPPEPKQEFSKMVMKKWTHIRDSWVKSMKYGYDETTKLPIKPYVYHNELKFMQKILKCKPRRYDFSIPSLESSNYEKFYNDKDGSQNSIRCEDNDDEKSHDNEQKHEENNDEFKQENVTLDDSNHVVENRALVEADEDDDDDWPIEEVTTPIIEIKREPNHVMSANNFKNESRSQQQQQSYPPRSQAKKRISIFKSFADIDEESSYTRKEKEHPCSSSSFNSNNYLDENRHWSFFKGILPSVNTLDEDQTLQFQAGVITLLQKLRNSQNCTPKPTKSSSKKRNANEDSDGDYQWPIHKVKLQKRYSTRGSRSNADPIGGEDLQFESESSE